MIPRRNASVVGTLVLICVFVACIWLLTAFKASASRSGNTLTTTASLEPAIPVQKEENSISSETGSGIAGSCLGGWQVVTSPNPQAYFVLLQSVDALTSNDVWAVGYSGDNNGNRQTLIEHWDGATWSIVPSPNPGTLQNELYDVEAVSANDVWAVGLAYSPSGPISPFVVHWDGASWSVSPTPYDGAYSYVLQGIDSLSSNNVWVVGSRITEQSDTPFVMKWNGSGWSVVPTAEIGSHRVLLDVTMLSPTNVWVAGRKSNQSNDIPFVARWNGSEWATITSQTQGNSSEFHAIEAVSASDLWAVGDSVFQTLIEHSTGGAWTTVSSANPGDFKNSLEDLAVVSANDIWAAGHYQLQSYPNFTLIQHWDGSQWTVAPSANPSTDVMLFGIDVVPGGGDLGEAWAVGRQNSGTGEKTLIEHFTNPCLTPTPTNTPLATSTPEPPRCPGERFTDVCSSDYFYTPVLALNDAGIVSGYNSAPPCETNLHVPCFKPYNNSTRGQIAKIVSLSAGFQEPVTTRTFEDIPTDHTFYQYIERLAERAIINGYPCGGPGEPCNPPENRPYFRPGTLVSRGQLAKLITLAFYLSDPVSGQLFEDVPVGSTFYIHVQQLATRNIINGYGCGGAGEPCVPPDNRPYFRPANSAARGQTAKIVYLLMGQVPPTPTSTPSDTATPQSTATPTSTELPLTPTSTPSQTETPIRK